MILGAVSHTQHPRGQADLGLRNVSSVQEEVNRVAGPFDVLQTPGNWERQPTPRLPSRWTQGFLSRVRSAEGPDGMARAKGETEWGGRGCDGA